MADGFAKGDPFRGLEPNDGFHAVRIQTAAGLTLSCLAYGGGVPFNLSPSGRPEDTSVELCTVHAPTPEQSGAVDRLYLVLDAVCRYFTTGGTWAELNRALDLVGQIVTGPMVFPGYYLVTSYSTLDGGYQHIFARTDGGPEAVLWEEPEVGDSGLPIGGFISLTTMDSLKESDDGSEWGPRVEEAAGHVSVQAEEGPAGLLPVLPPASVQGPGRPDPGPDGGGPR